MKEKLTQLLQEGQEKIRAARSEGELQEVKGLLLGKQGALTGLLKELPRLDVSLRPEMGKAVNQAKAQLTEKGLVLNNDLVVPLTQEERAPPSPGQPVADWRTGRAD